MQNLGGTMEYPLSTNELSADFGNNSMNDSLLKNQLRSSVIVNNDKLGITNSRLQTYAHPISNQGILSDRPKTTMQINS